MNKYLTAFCFLVLFSANIQAEKNTIEDNYNRTKDIVFENDDSAEDVLFPIFINKRWGFINQNGDVVIEPKFRSVGNFVNGLAPARINGLFGYINTSGEFVITPEFDFANDFSGKIATVWINGKQSFINEKGEKVSDYLKYKAVTTLKNGLIKVETHTGKSGLLNTEGMFVADTVFAWIRDYYENYATVSNLEGEISCIDTLGNLIVPYGKFKEIKKFTNGIAVARISLNENYCLINYTGKITCELPEGAPADWHYFSEGLIPVLRTSKEWHDHGDFKSYSLLFNYSFIDKYGNEIIRNPNYEDAQPFHNNRSLAGNREKYELIALSVS